MTTQAPTAMSAASLLAKETLTIEFKRDSHRLPDSELVEALVCLANTDGGELWRAACRTFRVSAPEVLLAVDFNLSSARTWIRFNFPDDAAPKGLPALRVARLDGVCCVATLANGRAIGCAPRLASIRPSAQRISRRKPDRLLGVEDDGTASGLHPDHQSLTSLAALVAARTSPSLSVSVEAIAVNGVTVARIRVPKAASEVATTAGVYLRRRLKADGTPECVAALPQGEAAA